MIRALFALLFVLLFFIVTLPLMLILLIIRIKHPDAAERVARPIIQWVFSTIRIISLTRMDIKGTENIPDGPVLFVPNHLSIFDVVILYPIMNRPSSFISKIELKKIPFLAQWMILIKAVFLDRDNIKQAIGIIIGAVDDINNGTSVIVFPEGTRSRTGEVLEFKEGTFKIATRTDCPVVPIAISNTDKILHSGLGIRTANVTIEFGQPIMTKDLDKDHKKHLGHDARERIIAMKEKNI
ncbi:MAG: 1-acyl-sn-glycerol-3-phosphate acyltransferase [Lachnospiraceae bacterium]|nr:1-acyl-sn-glycerol-3-phosphate acyltransferase [Lachnospiraceae bacterium]